MGQRLLAAGMKASSVIRIEAETSNDQCAETSLWKRHCRGNVLQRVIGLTVTLCMLMHPTTAEAKEAEGVAVGDEKAFFADIPIVMSATRLPQPLLATPVSTTVITRDMIEASGFNEIADVFRLVPGFQVAHATGGHFVVAYHGQELTLASRLEVLVDGRSVYGNLLSSVQWNTLGVELEDVERIEVVRGPNAPVFGANAMVATINIITRQPYAEQGTWIDATVGSIRTRDLLLRHAASLGELDYRFSLGWEENNGFNMDRDQGADFDDSKLAKFGFRGAWLPTSIDDVDIQLGLTTGQNATLNPESDVNASHHDGQVNSHFQFLRWTRSLGMENAFYLQFYHNYMDQHDHADVGPLSRLVDVSPLLIPFITGGHPDQVIDVAYADGVSERYDLELQHRKRLSQSLRVVWGGGARMDRLRSKAHLNRDDFIDNPSMRVFGNGEWTLHEKLSLNLGAMVEHNDLIGLFGSARIAANYRLSPKQALRASVSSVQRSPSILEENWDYLLRFNDGSPLNQVFLSPGHLKPEALVATEIGYALMPRDGDFQFDAKLFHEHATDLISNYRDLNYPEPFFQDGVEFAVNDDSYRISGIEGSVRWRPSVKDFLSLQYSITKSHRLLARGGLREPIKIDHDATPRRTYSLLFTHDFDHGLSGSLGYYYRSGIKWVGDGDKLPGYDRFDLRVAKKFSAGNKDGKLEFVAQNIGNDYQEYIKKELGRTTFETRYFVKMGLQF